mmetsp:Transcript_88546/g.237499  ORF Transcript_88546/g.237499 Transcript_88546/m.237499 type:complete len:529 (+) Transcript_88546:114-1700(+)
MTLSPFFLAAIVLAAEFGVQSTPPPAGSIVDSYGRLQVSGNHVVSSSGQPVRLRGMSLFWSQWMPQYWNGGATQWLTDDWKITLIRAAMAVENDGYLSNPAREKARVETVVDAAIAAGIYVIIDWHDHHAHQHLTQASTFFSEMAQKYGSEPNVIFEVYNEPIHSSWAHEIKPYHEEIVSVIRQRSDNLIILGTRTWSQDVDEAANDPVAGSNLAYTLHFYASTHRQSLRDKATSALAKGAALFVTEWGTCEASGDGALDLIETQRWLDFMETHHISDANWAVSDKSEACSALQPGASGTGGWTAAQLTASGSFVRASLIADAPSLAPGPPPSPSPSPPPPPPTSPPAPPAPTPPEISAIRATPAPCDSCSGEGEDCRASRCCSDPGMKCHTKNEHWAGCMATCTPGIHPGDPPEHRTPWTCDLVLACAGPGEDCSASLCCSELGKGCYKKDEYWAACKDTCTPGIDMNDPPQYRTPWDCELLGDPVWITQCEPEFHGETDAATRFGGAAASWACLCFVLIFHPAGWQ